MTAWDKYNLTMMRLYNRYYSQSLRGCLEQENGKLTKYGRLKVLAWERYIDEITS